MTTQTIIYLMLLLSCSFVSYVNGKSRGYHECESETKKVINSLNELLSTLRDKVIELERKGLIK